MGGPGQQVSHDLDGPWDQPHGPVRVALLLPAIARGGLPTVAIRHSGRRIVIHTHQAKDASLDQVLSAVYHHAIGQEDPFVGIVQIAQCHPGGITASSSLLDTKEGSRRQAGALFALMVPSVRFERTAFSSYRIRPLPAAMCPGASAPHHEQHQQVSFCAFPRSR